ncbi:MAG TPA: K(+)-transporting ATPase subunit C [Acidimicrobiia bacterium]|jgi:K+-transporting ATPase ATPase C chain
MRRQLLPALGIFLAITVVCGLVYPLVVLGVAQGVFRGKADGSLVNRDGKVIGSSLLAQGFTEAKYFHPRPSAAGADGYDGAASGSSNLGPSNPELVKTVAQRAVAYRKENGLRAGAKVPTDAVTASGSGLDPDVTVANADLQARRVARARNLEASVVLDLIARHTNGRQLGFLGERTVNVLDLNLALDRLPRT